MPLRAESREQLLQTGSTVLDETSGATRSRRPSGSVPTYIEEVGLDSLVGGDGESGDVVLPCREGLDRALPADLRIVSPRRPLAARSSTVTGITNRPSRLRRSRRESLHARRT